MGVRLISPEGVASDKVGEGIGSSVDDPATVSSLTNGVFLPLEKTQVPVATVASIKRVIKGTTILPLRIKNIPRKILAH